MLHWAANSRKSRTPERSQVHRAVGLDGRQLAVKVQHAGLRESGAVDVATIGTAARALAWAVPDYDYSWIAEETASNLPLVRTLALTTLILPTPLQVHALRRARTACAPPTCEGKHARKTVHENVLARVAGALRYASAFFVSSKRKMEI